MGNNHSKEEESEVTTQLNLKQIKQETEEIKQTLKDELEVFLESTVSNKLKEISHFKEVYRLKNKLRTQSDIFYEIKVLENTRSGRLFNLKIITMSDIEAIGLEKFKTFFSNEMRALQKFRHAHIESLVNVYYDKSNKQIDSKIYVVTNYTTRFSLLDMINKRIEMKRRFDLADLKIIMKILIYTIYTFKKENLIHRNLSPENIFFLKEGDFRTLCIRNLYFSSFLQSGGKTKGMTGPLHFMAPEVMKEANYDFKADVWSLGVTFYLLLTLENPFNNCKNRDEMLYAYKSDNYIKKTKFWKKYNLSEPALNFIFRMLCLDPEIRASPDLLMDDPLFKEDISKLNKHEYAKLVIYDWKLIEGLKYKVENLPSMHEIIFAIFKNLKDFIVATDNIIVLNEFYNSIDCNKDGNITRTEIKDYLKMDNTITDECKTDYLEIIHVLINNSHPNKKDNIVYTYEDFITANVLLNTFCNKDQEFVKKRLMIMFLEMDEDKSDFISIKEIQSVCLQNDSDVDIKEKMVSVTNQPFYDQSKVDLNQMSVEELQDFLFYECVRLDSNQEVKLKRKDRTIEDEVDEGSPRKSTRLRKSTIPRKNI